MPPVPPGERTQHQHQRGVGQHLAVTPKHHQTRQQHQRTTAHQGKRFGLERPTAFGHFGPQPGHHDQYRSHTYCGQKKPK